MLRYSRSKRPLCPFSIKHILMMHLITFLSGTILPWSTRKSKVGKCAAFQLCWKIHWLMQVEEGLNGSDFLKNTEEGFSLKQNYWWSFLLHDEENIIMICWRMFLTQDSAATARSSAAADDQNNGAQPFLESRIFFSKWVAFLSAKIKNLVDTKEVLRIS